MANDYWKGKKFSEEHLANLRKSRIGKKPMLGKKHSPETIAKMSERYKEKWKDPKYRERMAAVSRKSWRENRDKMMNGPQSVPKGENSYQWRGDFVGYKGIHTWLVQQFGNASVCENKHCEKISTTFEWSKLRGVEYERRRENFWQLCQKCHRNYDKDNDYKIEL